MATIYSRGDVWYLNWNENGKRKRKSLGKITEQEARKCLSQLEIGRAPTFETFSYEYLAWHQLEFPDSHFRVHQITEQWLIPYFERARLDAISRRDAELYKQSRKSAPATVAKELRTLQAIFNKAVEWECINRNPIRGVKPPKDNKSKPPRFYTADEMSAIYASAPNHHNIWRLMVNTGMRRSEALQLKWADIGSDSILIESTERARTKSGKWREVPISKGARAALQGIGRSSGYVVPHVHPKSLSRAFENTLRRAKLGGSLHCLRHSFCSHLVMRGTPLRTVQVLAGHANITTTEKYAHLAPDYLKGIMEGIEL